MSKLTHKIREWSFRYLPAEVIATVTALVGAFIAHQITDSMIVAAYVGTISENIGYYGYFVIRESISRYRDSAGQSPIRRVGVTIAKTSRNLLLEFGIAELLDSLVIRPFFMYMGQRLIPNFAVGIFAGKIAADVVFYVFAIAGYEVKKRI